MKKKTYVLGMAVLLAALMALAGVAQSAMWVGGQIGGNFPVSSDVSAEAGRFSGNIGDADWRSSVIGGAALGYDFVNKGFGAYAWPDWAKYFSVFTDFTYNRRDLRSPGLPAVFGIGRAGFPLPPPGGHRIEGSDMTWSFMLMAHYPFLPDSEVPEGRLNPYIAVGPGILFSTIDVGKGWGGASSVNIALVAEAGVRFMCLKNVSIDGACRYRYAAPSYDLEVLGQDVTLDAESLHQISFLFRANYHF
jgi:opacity protein-like surface antigen